MATKALLIGINDYSPVGPGGPDLSGCINDVRDVLYTLNSFGIIKPVPAQLRVLTDKGATKANIMAGAQWLMQGCKRGDLLIFYYSGHGSQLPDLGNLDDIDRKDETICPHDYASAGMIRDDDLRKVFSCVPADGSITLEVLLDSCHAGSGTRELGARYIEAPFDS